MAAATVHPSASFARPSRGVGGIIGDWYNVDSATRDITRITISVSGGIVAHTYGACVPTACDWGTVPVSTAGTDVYHFSFAIKRQTIQRYGAELRVISRTHFIDGSGRADYTSIAYFYRAPVFASGIYVNVDPLTGGLTKLVLGQNADGSYSVHPFGRCHPTDCDWGSANTTFTATPAAVATFAFGFKTSTVSLTNSGSYLRAVVTNHFTDGSGRSDYTGVYYLRLPVGTWVNADTATRDVTRIQIDQLSDGRLIAHAYGACEPTDCDWGSAPLALTGATYVATFHFSFATATLTLTPGDPTLQVEDATHFTDGSGRADLDLVESFNRA
jgi:hypothetical protein